MPRIAKAICQKTSSYPWYEWVKRFKWEDDEFEDKRQAQVPQKCRRDEMREMREKYHKENK
jgi:hypothetical protein